MRTLNSNLNSFIMHSVLIIYTLICMFPVYLLINNAFKSRRAIFKQPLSLPNEDTFSLAGFLKMFTRIDFSIYFYNSILWNNEASEQVIFGGATFLAAAFFLKAIPAGLVRRWRH